VSSRASRAAGIAAVVAAVFASGAAGTRTPPPEDLTGRAALAALADSLDRRLAALERELAAARSARSPSRDMADRYARLRAREASVAQTARAWLRFVPIGSPVDGGILTSTFGPARFHPIWRRVQPHLGVDIAAAEGTPVRATADGVVYAVAENATYGRVVDVVHGRSGYITRVAHLRAIAVRPGRTVRRGEVLGYVGRTGVATGAHCHYEVFLHGRRRDPLAYLGSTSVADSIPILYD
jgi:murein DD-endopeptidase MepM/ murein hydrolase activator NlpD